MVSSVGEMSMSVSLSIEYLNSPIQVSYIMALIDTINLLFTMGNLIGNEFHYNDVWQSIYKCTKKLGIFS